MISQDILRWTSLGKSWKHVTRWKGYARGCRMKKEFPLLESEAIIGRSLKMQSLKYSTMNTVLRRNFQLQKLHNRMEWLKERTE